jgi:hypothetical protein
VLAFSAPNQSLPDAKLADVSADISKRLLTVVNPDWSPLWNGQDPIHAREAEEEEWARWDQGVEGAIHGGDLHDRDQTVSEGFVVYLVPVISADDDEPEE